MSTELCCCLARGRLVSLLDGWQFCIKGLGSNARERRDLRFGMGKGNGKAPRA